MLGAWKLKNQMEVQELSKNLFLFRFAIKRDLESVLKNGPWSFDINLLILSRISGEEQPSDLNMHYGIFWVRIYELPLMLRFKAKTKKIGGILGQFEELDTKEAHGNERFLRIKFTIDLKKPLKRGTMDTNSRIVKLLGELSEEGFEDLEDQDLSFGTCLRASPSPRVQEEMRKKDCTSSSCSKSLFNISSRHSRCKTREITNW
ncbi:unnamed protein product [Vicia faba]|uniref:DUF4283 domain-containing protein n=1 Tax=Vicia faba TaxID=3906 RepID=A0AAV1BCB9_VICFA|nr:unnamed protein product [Vicia faba]